MSLSRIGTRHLLVASLGLICVLSVAPRAFGQDGPDAPAAATTDDEPIVPDTPFPSIIALDEEDAVWTLGLTTGTLKVNGDIAVNSVNRGAIWLSDSSIEARNGQVSVVGGVSRLGKTSIRPLPAIGGTVVIDPLPEFRIPAPTNVISREKLFLRSEENGDDTLLPPGIYNGGIFATGKGHITLQPGVFVMTNGDFTAIGPTIEGEGVTIVMAGNTPGGLSISLGAQLNVSAPTSGKLKDLVIISRSESKNAKGIWFANAQGNMKGIVYAPKASFAMQYTNNVKVSKIIARSISVTSGVLDVTGFADPNAPLTKEADVRADNTNVPAM